MNQLLHSARKLLAAALAFALLILTACNQKNPIYRIYEASGKWYFEATSDIGSFDALNTVDSSVAFESMEEMYTALTTGKLSDRALSSLHVCDRCGSKFEICDPNELYLPILPAEATTPGIRWSRETYYIDFESPAGYGNCRFGKTAAEPIYTPECKHPETLPGIIRTETLPETNATAYWQYSENSDPQNTLLLNYLFDTGDGTMYITAEYAVPDTFQPVSAIIAAGAPRFVFFHLEKDGTTMVGTLVPTDAAFDAEWILGFDFSHYRPAK